MELDKLLTRREISVGKLMAEGRTNKEIALRLNLSSGTIKNYSSNIIHKLKVSNRVEAAVTLFKSSIHGCDEFS